MMTRILCLWLPNWPIQRLIQFRPELKSRPLALVASTPRGGQVAACSSSAAAQGIHPAMPVAEAQALARELAITPHEPSTDRRVLEKLAEACERFAPCVALEEGDAPECLLLDISNLEHLWGGEHKLAAQVKNFFTRRGYEVRIGIEGTIGLAWALAHFGIADCGTQRVPGIADYSLQSEVRNPKSEIELPVEALRIPDDTAALLRELGVKTVAQLQSLPREDLSSRFGDGLLRRLDQFTGAAREAIEPHRPLAALEAACSLDEPTADRAVLLHVLASLVEQLCRQLSARDQGAVLLTGALRCAAGRAAPLRIGLVDPSANPRQLLELIELRLENLMLTEEVDRVEIRAAVAGRLNQRQRELFADRWPSDPHQLALLVNRLSSRLGSEQVLRAELRPSPVPERAVRWMPMTEKSRVESRESRARIPALDYHRPLLLEPKPQPLEMTSIAPDGPPQFIWLESRRERIVHCAGPERIETLWWRGPSVRRDYYRIATESGNHLWIFRRLADARWFLHGTFA
jgi:protein ImuB